MIKYFYLLVFACLVIPGHAQNKNPKQSNVPGSDFAGDAPWRMKKTDSLGNLKGIPVTVYIKDANEATFNADLIYVDIFIKNATSNSFGNPIVFNTYTDSAFKAKFSAKSQYDSQLDVQSFDASLPVKDSVHTVMFTAENCTWPDNCTYVDVNHAYWFFTITIPPEMLTSFGDVVDIEVYFSLNWQTDESRYLRVFRYDNDLPKMPGWYRGDSHCHTLYTNNSAEYGLPIPATKIAAKNIGIDWITTTDHSCDFDNYGISMQSNWSKEDSEILALNTQDTSMILIHGEEVSSNNSAGEVVHMCAYPNDSLPYSMPYLGDGNGDITATTLSVDYILSILAGAGGFAYAAHPFAANEKLPSLINGGIWDISDTGFYADGAPLPGHDNVICNDPSKPQIKGGEIWNCRKSLFTTDDDTNPWNVLYSSSTTPFVPFDTTSVEWHYNRLLQNLEVVKYLNKKGLAMKNSNPSLQNYRFYMIAGTDSHGSFNFSNTDFVMGVTSDIHDNALGKVATVVYCPTGMGNGGKNVLHALKNGNAVMSDGPIVTLGLSTDGNNNTDEYISGQEALLSLWDYEHTKIRLQMVTTPEYGSFHQLHIIAGTQHREYSLILPLDTTVLNNVYIYSLDSLLSQILAGDSIQDNEYFYIRAEISCLKEYGAVATLHARQNEIFHSLTNPIWIRKPLSITTSLNNFVAPEFCNIYPNPFASEIQIDLHENNNSSVVVKLFNIIGDLEQSCNFANCSGYDHHFVIQTKGLPANVYLLKVIAGNKEYHYKLVKTTND